VTKCPRSTKLLKKKRNGCFCVDRDVQRPISMDYFMPSDIARIVLGKYVVIAYIVKNCGRQSHHEANTASFGCLDIVHCY